MQAEVTDLIEEQGRVAGARVTTSEGPLDVTADLVVAADGRRSIVRERAGLQVMDIGAPMDVLWMRVSKLLAIPANCSGVSRPGRCWS